MTRSPAPHSDMYDLLTSTTSKVSRVASRVFNQQFGVGVLEWRILRLLSSEEKLAANDVCRILDVDKAAVSRSIAFLEERGWISRSADVKDARRRLLGLTSSGALLKKRLAEIAEEVSRDVFADLTETDKAVLGALLERISANATELIRRDGFRNHPSRADGTE